VKLEKQERARVLKGSATLRQEMARSAPYFSSFLLFSEAPWREKKEGGKRGSLGGR